MARDPPCYPPCMEYDRYKNIPNVLKEHRKARGLTQQQVAHLLGLKDPTWISHWEKGDVLPNLVSAIRLSTLYQTTIDTLFTDLVEAVRREIR